MINRRKAKVVRVGSILIGGDAPISVQSMTNTLTEDIRATVRQIRRLEKAGCEIVRVAVPTQEAAKAISEIKKAIRIPLVADVHFDYRLALLAVERGADKVRINPGNIGAADRVERVLKAAKDRRIPIRIGVNSGSLEKALLRRFGGVSAEALVESALSHVWLCEEAGFEDIVVSIKAPNVPLLIQTNRLLAEKVPYPIHLGVTESGTLRTGTIRSAVGIGTLLAGGIGDTIRVSLTGDPVEEVHAGYEILKSLHLRQKGITVVSCPTCGRTHGNLIAAADAVERALSRMDKPLTVAVMGCEVNGPGEAREADLGVAFGKKQAILFKMGKPVRRIRIADVVRTVAEAARQWPD